MEDESGDDSANLPAPSPDKGNALRPTITELIESFFGITLPKIPLPQTLKNADKALSVLVLALGKNITERLSNSTKMIQVKGKLARIELENRSEADRKADNRVNVGRIAMEVLSDQSNDHDAPSEIESDWLNMFARFSEDKSSEELQTLFGKILAGEIRQPGSFSLRTLQFFSVLTKTEAEQLSTYFSYSLDGKIVPYHPQKKGGPSVPLQTLMFDLGVAGAGSFQIANLSRTYTVAPRTRHATSGIGKAILIENNTDREIQFRIMGQPITTTGREILKIASPPEIDLAFLESVAIAVGEYLKSAYPAEFDQGLITVHLGRVDQDIGRGIFAEIIKDIIIT